MTNSPAGTNFMLAVAGLGNDGSSPDCANQAGGEDNFGAGSDAGPQALSEISNTSNPV
ncbi:MAG: hypothetical protein LBV36_03670 [Chromatiales bacterium]|nr:hypothetical protein [Chromatiales bacterium]